MATDIVRFVCDGIEIYVDRATGESFTSVRGYARMSNKDASTISRRLQGVASSDQKTTEIQTAGGLQGVALISEDLICEWLPKDNPESAKKLLKLGIRVALHQMAGYSHPAPIALPPADIRLHNLTNSLQFLSDRLDVDLSNPRYCQELKDYALNLIVGHQKQIAAAKEPEWMGVVEMAIDMGYQPSLVNQNRSQLGRFVAAFGFDLRKEKRLCNGAMHPINLYRDCEEVRTAIAEFLDAKVLSSAAN